MSESRRREEPAAGKAPAATVLRLLEEGSAEELSALFARWGEEAVAEIAERAGARRLSARSRRFWRLLLDRPIPSPTPVARAVWPLA